MKFVSIPRQNRLPGLPHLSDSGILLIDAELEKLLAKRAIDQVSHCEGEFRPVIYLKPLNEFVQKIHFKIENIDLFYHLLHPGDFMGFVGPTMCTSSCACVFVTLESFIILTIPCNWIVK